MGLVGFIILELLYTDVGERIHRGTCTVSRKPAREPSAHTRRRSR